MATTKATGSVIADNSITLAKMASGTDGNVISYDASGNPVAIATGSDGQVLTSTGAGSPPAFEDAGGGGGGAWTFLSLVTATTATTVDIETTFDDTYHAYVVVASNVYGSAVSPIVKCLLKIGGTYQTSNYYGHMSQPYYASSGYNGVAMSNASAITVQDQVSSAIRPSGWVMTMPLDPTDTASRKFVTWSGHAGGSYRNASGSCNNQTAGALTGIRYQIVDGTLGGKFRLYGINKS